MNKQKKQFLVLIIILIVLIAVYLGAVAYADAVEKQDAEKEDILFSERISLLRSRQMQSYRART